MSWEPRRRCFRVWAIPGRATGRASGRQPILRSDAFPRRIGISRQAWVAALEGAVAEAGRDVVLVTHSLGCLLVAHWARYPTHPVRGALLVAVPAEQGSCVVRIGTAGHINAASQLGDWPEGFALLEPLTGRPDTP